MVVMVDYGKEGKMDREEQRDGDKEVASRKVARAVMSWEGWLKWG